MIISLIRLSTIELNFFLPLVNYTPPSIFSSEIRFWGKIKPVHSQYSCVKLNISTSN